ncbi:hypothetical protein IE53DRAFT_362998 [Violaceomyces palustris]|uniref:Uncharacterized protein n=1 Tax=Violaceomyces palustris TaxID=1673888 RepID=A0ACD0NV26_9BASI|nr:hypothetical protein IE53DRAFT_362998 [Violaceomyces palustris]
MYRKDAWTTCSGRSNQTKPFREQHGNFYKEDQRMPNLTYELPSRSQVRQAGSGSIFTNQQPWRWSISNDQKRDPLTSASGSPATSLLLLVPPSERRQASDLASTSASPEPLLQPDQQTSWSRFEYGDGVKANDHQRFSLECRSGRAGRRKAEGEWRRKGLGGGDSASEKRSKRTRSSPLDPNEILNLRRAIKICFLPPSATGQDEGNGQGSGSRSIELFHSLLPLLLPGRQSARDARWLEGLAKEAVISDRGEVALPSSAFRPPPPPPPLTPGSYTGTGEQLGCSIQESHRPLVQGPNPVEAFKKRRLRGNADEEEDLRIPLPPWWISKASKKKTKKAVEDDSMTTQRSNMEMNVEERRSVPEEAVTAEAVTGEKGEEAIQYHLQDLPPFSQQ